jgi:hypothetical protein
MIKAIAILMVLTTQAEAKCHIFSVWRFPWPQHCEAPRMVAQRTVEPPPPKLAEPPSLVTDFPLPSLDHMEFPPDSTNERLKGIGLLREYYGTN